METADLCRSFLSFLLTGNSNWGETSCVRTITKNPTTLMTLMWEIISYSESIIQVLSSFEDENQNNIIIFLFLVQIDKIKLIMAHKGPVQPNQKLDAILISYLYKPPQILAATTSIFPNSDPNPRWTQTNQPTFIENFCSYIQILKECSPREL